MNHQLIFIACLANCLATSLAHSAAGERVPTRAGFDINRLQALNIDLQQARHFETLLAFYLENNV